MRQKFFKYLFVLSAFTLFITACEVDPLDPVDEDDPTVSVQNFPTGEIAVGSIFTVNVTAAPNDAAQLKTLDITEDNQLISFDRITINGTAATANPKLLLGDDKNGFSWGIAIQAHDTPGTKEYSFNIADDNNNQSSFAIDITTTLDLPSLTVDLPEAFEAPEGAIIAIPIDFAPGSLDLSTIAVYENEALIDDYSRLFYSELANNFDTNPYPIPEADKSGVSTNMYLKLAETTGTNNYSIVISDVDGNTANFDFTAVTVTPVDELTGVLFNAGGPVGTGGLDLDDGIGTGSLDPIAEIKDEGIDLDLPVDQNWKKSISGVNGSEVKQLKPGENGLSETFAYDDISSKAEVAAVFENGTAFTVTNNDGELISDSVNVGDMFTVKNGDNYYIIIVREVNETSDNNEDNYVLDIKK